MDAIKSLPKRKKPIHISQILIFLFCLVIGFIMRFLAAGIHAFVLQYSVAPSRYPSAALELATAVRLVRQNAKEWNIFPDQIHIMMLRISPGRMMSFTPASVIST